MLYISEVSFIIAEDGLHVDTNLRTELREWILQRHGIHAPNNRRRGVGFCMEMVDAEVVVAIVLSP